jgi:hypothetical protein
MKKTKILINQNNLHFCIISTSYVVWNKNKNFFGIKSAILCWVLGREYTSVNLTAHASEIYTYKYPVKAIGDTFLTQKDGRKKRARWWNRLGGEPVGHAASPRIGASHQATIITISKNNNTNTTYGKSCQIKSLKFPPRPHPARLTTSLMYTVPPSNKKCKLKN